MIDSNSGKEETSYTKLINSLTLDEQEALKTLRITGVIRVEVDQDKIYSILVEKGLATAQNNPTDHLIGWAADIPQRQQYLKPTRTYRAL